MSFPRYPSYKDSGIAGLGKIPSHWEVKPLKHLAAIDSCGSYGVEVEEAEIALPVATTAQIDADGRFAVDRMPVRGFVPAEVQRFGCSDGDILVVKSSGSATNIISGKAGLVDESTPPFVFSNFLMRVRPSRNLAIPKFIYALLRSQLTRQRVEQMCSTTTYPNLKVGEYCSAPLPIPPPAEQTQIATFLDRETGKIDALITEQRRLVELLKEKRQAVISNAVTQGLNPNAPMKPSGIEWLGDVPAHWELKATKRLFRLVAEPAPDDNDHELLSIYTAIGVRPRKELEAKGNKATTTDGYWLVQKGDLIVNKLLAWMGAIGISEYDGVTSPAYDILRQRIPLDPHFYDYLFRCGICFSEFRRWSRGIMDMRLRLYFDELGQLVMPYPPESEQREIVTFLQVELDRFDTLTAEAQRAIDLLQERRTALISAAVTGQIDVRPH